jgi:hypothetical protein
MFNYSKQAEDIVTPRMNVQQTPSQKFASRKTPASKFVGSKRRMRNTPRDTFDSPNKKRKQEIQSEINEATPYVNGEELQLTIQRDAPDSQDASPKMRAERLDVQRQGVSGFEDQSRNENEIEK